MKMKYIFILHILGCGHNIEKIDAQAGIGESHIFGCFGTPLTMDMDTIYEMNGFLRMLWHHLFFSFHYFIVKDGIGESQIFGICNRRTE